ncbi:MULTISPECIES: hypothetical protein [unclassified Roseovarius]|uniref:hypothetical protein n=1 Tax=unclassified Roseovarius TaxID=2614913 RepID=UPI00273EF2D8|nr:MULTISPECIES: hypothetical protein [unclassified Roseovarius]
MFRFLNRYALVAGALAANAPLVAHADEPDRTIPGSVYLGASTIEFTNEADASDVKEGFLWYYRSPLGTALRDRDMTSGELSAVQRVCHVMRDMAIGSPGGAFDVYGIEFVDASGDPTQAPLSQRSVFFFYEEGRCNDAPLQGGVQ